MNKIKVLIVDDSALVRKVFSDILSSDSNIEVIGIAQNGKIAMRKIEELKPDIITLDVEMPELDGFGVLQEIYHNNLKVKVIMVSGATTEGAKTTIKALERGAVDFIAKPSPRANDLKELSDRLLDRIHTVAKIDFKKVARRVKFEDMAVKPVTKTIIQGDIPNKFVAIGTSTGGPQALKEIFENDDLPENCAYLIVQHMPAEFTPPFAERLNQISKLRVKEASDNDEVVTGWVYLAPGHSHMEIKFKGPKPYIKLNKGEKVSGHRPSIDVLFKSIASSCANKTLAVIMTGMGRDGALGIKAIKEKGGTTLAQDKESSVVFGMNKEAIELGGINEVTPLREIPSMIKKKIG